MSTEQKPPIDITPNTGPKAGPLDPSEPRPRLTQQKSGGSGGGGTNWMPAIVAIVVSLALSALMVFVFNPTKAGIDTLSSQIIELDNRAITLEADSSRLDTFISTSANYATQGDLTGLTNGMATESSVSDLQSSIDSLRNENGFLNDRIAELEIVEAIEEEEEEAEAESVFGEVRWNIKDVQLVDATWTNTESYVEERSNDYFIDIDADDIIEEEDLYYLDVQIEVDDDGAFQYDLNTKDAYIEFVLYPRDDATLDQDLTYVDSDDPPWLEWDADFVTKTREGIEVTRRVVFSSDELGDHGTTYQTIEAGEELEIDLVLELYYE